MSQEFLNLSLHQVSLCLITSTETSSPRFTQKCKIQADSNTLIIKWINALIWHHTHDFVFGEIHFIILGLTLIKTAECNIFPKWYPVYLFIYASTGTEASANSFSELMQANTSNRGTFSIIMMRSLLLFHTSAETFRQSRRKYLAFI